GSTVVIGTALVILEYRTSSGGDLGESLLIGEISLEVDMIVAEINEDLKKIDRVAVIRRFEEIL
ncbi:hypothetical protein A2U01_0111506, partial [Trifolium medium]|nr:hypothetical protein [Trifolium medium]